MDDVAYIGILAAGEKHTDQRDTHSCAPDLGIPLQRRIDLEAGHLSGTP